MILLLTALSDSVIVASVQSVEDSGDYLIVRLLDSSAIPRADFYHVEPVGLLEYRLEKGPAFAFWRRTGDTLTLYSRRVFAVVVDAGHGGQDFGAIGVYGYKEKDINLSVALRLADILMAKGYRVYLTRERDTFITLFERADLANSIKAKEKVYISLHCNFMSDTLARGLETYFLTLRKATTRRAVELLENYPDDALEVAGGEVGFILGDVLQSEFLEDSRQLAMFIHRHLRKYTTDRGVRQANFHVLRRIYSPSVLVELGYMSNPVEVRKLLNPAYQDSIARDIGEGVDEYFRWKWR